MNTSDVEQRPFNGTAGKASTVGRRSSRLQRIWNSPKALNLLYLPVLILFAIFIVYPFIQGIRLSFTDWNGYSPKFNWVGLEKYQYLLTDLRVRQVLMNTFFYGTVSTFLQNILGLAYALFLDQKLKCKAF